MISQMSLRVYESEKLAEKLLTIIPSPISCFQKPEEKDASQLSYTSLGGRINTVVPRIIITVMMAVRYLLFA